MEEKKQKNKRMITVIVIAVLMLCFLTTSAYFVTQAVRRNQVVKVETGNLALVFSDGNAGFKAELDFDKSATKTFTIENTGTLDASANMNFHNLVNTFTKGSLTYTLEYSTTEDGTYEELVSDVNIPISTNPTDTTLKSDIEVPAGLKYYYKLIITLNYLTDVDQTGDLDATMSTEFELSQVTEENETAKFWIPKAVVAMEEGRTPEGIKKGTPNFSKSVPYDINFNTAVEGNTLKDFYNVENDTSYPFEYDETTGWFTSTNHDNGTSSSITIKPNENKHLIACFDRSSFFGCDTSGCGGDAGNAYLNDTIIYGLYTSYGTFYEDTSCVDLGLLSSSDEIKVSYDKSFSDSEGRDNIKFAIFDGSQFDTSGVYAMEDDYGTSYYFRGDIKDNYIKFAGFYWRAIRINGDGSVRMIYDGTTPHENGEDSEDRLMSIAWNTTNYNDAKYVGYMYGGANGTASTSKSQAQTNETSTNVKTQLESWYKTNIADKGYDQYVSDEIFCNDRSTISGNGYGTSKTSYGAYGRLVNNKSPQFTCPQKNDAFTKDDTEKGNGALSQKVGLITADEISAAGGVVGLNNTNYYLHKGSWYWSLSPSDVDFIGRASVFIVDTDGALRYYFVDDTFGTAPVINLSAEYAKKLTGSGLIGDEYELP